VKAVHLSYFNIMKVRVYEKLYAVKKQLETVFWPGLKSVECNPQSLSYLGGPILSGSSVASPKNAVASP